MTKVPLWASEGVHLEARHGVGEGRAKYTWTRTIRMSQSARLGGSTWKPARRNFSDPPSIHGPGQSRCPRMPAWAEVPSIP